MRTIKSKLLLGSLILLAGQAYGQTPPLNIVHSTNTTVSTTVEEKAIISITAADAGSNYIVDLNGDVTFRAGREINLEEDFEVQVGGEFCAIAQPLVFGQYNALKDQLDGGYVNTGTTGMLKIRFIEEYSVPDGSLLNYKISNEYDWPVTGSSLPKVSVSKGINELTLDFKPSGLLQNASYYILRTYNSKGEEQVLRFYYEDGSNTAPGGGSGQQGSGL